MSYASTSDVTAITGGTYDTARLNALLQQASDHLAEEVIGCRVAVPSETITVDITAPSGQTAIRLPSAPVRSITTVLLDGSAVTDWQLHDGKLHRRCGWRSSTCRPFVTVRVTYVHGYDTAPSDLKAWTVALAAQAYKLIEELGTPSLGPIQSVRIDDYSVAYATASDPSAGAGMFHVPEAVAQRLRAAYGGGYASDRP